VSFNKAIKSGKEKRKPYRGAKSYDVSCRNHGSCDYCKSNRIHFDEVKRKAADADLNEFKKKDNNE